MRRYFPSIWIVILCNVLAIAAFIVRITNNFIPLIANSLSIGVFVFAATGLVTLVIYMIGSPWHTIVKVLVVPVTIMFGVGLLFYVFIFSSFTIINAEKLEYNGNKYYYFQDATSYTSYGLYKQKGVQMEKLTGMTQEETKLPYQEERVKELIDRLDY